MERILFGVLKSNEGTKGRDREKKRKERNGLSGKGGVLAAKDRRQKKKKRGTTASTLGPALGTGGGFPAVL